MSSLAYGYGYSKRQRRVTLNPAGPVAPFPPNLDSAFIGDSRFAFGFDPLLDGTGYNARLQPISVAGWIGALSDHKIRVGRNANFGENGNTTTQMVANPRLNSSNTTNPATWFRKNSLAAGDANDISLNNPGQKSLAALAAHASGLKFLLASTNDAVGTLGTTSRANILTIIASAPTAVSIVYNELPRGVDKNGNAASVATNPAERKALSDWIKTLDYASGDVNAKANVIVIDSWAEFVDPASGTNYLNKRGWLYDGLHLSQYGAMRLAKITVDRLKAIWPNWNSLPSFAVKPTAHGLTTPGTQQPYVNSNPIMATVGGNGSTAGTFANVPDVNQIPTGWELVATANASGITATPSKTDIGPGGFTAFGIDFNGTVGANLLAQAEFRQRFSSAALVNAEVAAGRLSFTDKLRAFGRVFVPFGSTGLYFPSLELFIQEATATKRMTARVHAAQRSMFRDVDGMDCGGVWYDLYSEVLDLAEPNMAITPGNVSAVNSIVLKWNFYLGNDTVAAVQTIATGKILVAETGFLRVTS